MRLILLLIPLAMCVQSLTAQTLRMHRTHYEFRFDALARGQWWWNKNPHASDSSMLVREDGFLVCAATGAQGFSDTLHLIGNWPGVRLCVNGRVDDATAVVPVPPRHVGRFTPEEWQDLGDAGRAEIRDGTTHWPVDFGAPFFDADTDGRYTPDPDALPELPGDAPLVIGDEAMWTLTGDGETPDRRRMMLSTAGVQLQQMAWTHAGEGCPEWVIFQRLRIVNTTTRFFRAMHIGIYADAALGDPSDDLVGVDSTLGLAYFYNASDTDAYMNDPPAAGYLLLQGPAIEDASSTGLFNLSRRAGIRNLPYHAFTYFSDTGEYQALPDTTDDLLPYKLQFAMAGRHPDASAQVDPTTAQPTHFAVNGNPLLNLGWIDGTHAAAGHRTLLVSMGPFNLAQGDTQEVIIARIAAQGGPTTEEDLIALFDYAQCVSAHYMAQFVTSAEQPQSAPPLPREAALGRPWPQPYAASARGALQVPLTLSAPRSVTLRIVDLLGRTRYTEEVGRMPAGAMTVSLSIPSSLSSGMYLLVAETGSGRSAQPVIIE